MAVGESKKAVALWESDLIVGVEGVLHSVEIFYCEKSSHDLKLLCNT